jgi:AcrR family transcriptional regulator
MDTTRRFAPETFGAVPASLPSRPRRRGRTSGDGVKRAQADRRRESMTLILDQAEILFAQDGYYGVTLRDVADAAGVDTSLMRYYFGDKEKLFAAVWERRSPFLNDLKSEALAEYRAKAGDHMELEGVIEAFVRPPFELMMKDEGWRHYMSIVAFVNSSRGMIATLMLNDFDRVSREVLSDFARIFPNAPKERLYWGYHFLSGALTFSFGQTGRTDRLSDGMCNSRDAEAMLKRLPITLAAGIRALCEAPPERFASTAPEGAKRGKKGRTKG